ncbi:MAG TPA: ATP-binding protein [Steroidobacteraceae bacterium]
MVGESPMGRPDCLRLAQLADMIGFANAVLGQIFAASNDDLEVWSEFSVDAMARDILPMLRASVRGRARITLSEDSHSPLLHGNPLALKRALLHVVLSLVRTIEVPHGQIDIGVALITFAHGPYAADYSDCAAPRRVVRLTVVDNGIGMDQDRINALPQSGFDARPVLRREDAGLQMACSIVKAHGGQLDIEAHAGIGTMIRIDLPLAVSERAPQTRSDKSP